MDSTAHEGNPDSAAPPSAQPGAVASVDAPPEMTPELVTYYADRRLMIRNVTLIGLCNLSWNVAFTITGPLIILLML